MSADERRHPQINELVAEMIAERETRDRTEAHVARLRKATSMIADALRSDPYERGLWGDTIELASIEAARAIACRDGGP